MASRRGDPARGEFVATILGAAAILIWSTSFCVARSARGAVGIITTPMVIYLAGGIIGTAYLAVRGQLGKVSRMPRKYLFGCGGLFVAYMVLIYLAVGLPERDSQILEVQVINYLWPMLTVVLSVPVLRLESRVWLIPGAMLAFAGVVLAAAQGGELSWSGFAANARANAVPYVLALGAAVTWGLYSTLSRRWAADVEGTPVPVFVLATGVAMAVIRLFFPERSVFTTRVVLEIAYMAVFPAVLAYTFWDAAMRRGRVVLVASMSYVTPLLAIVASVIYLGLAATGMLWLGCAMVIAGAVICRLSVSEPRAGPPLPPASTASPSPAPAPAPADID